MMNQNCLFLFFFLFLYSNCSRILAQSPAPAPAPAPQQGPTNVIKILKKSGQFKTFIRLLKTTQLDSNLNSQLGNTNNGLTIFAPSDSAFSRLKKRTISSLTHQQTVELVQFHIVPSFISTSQFDTVTNPLKTHAGSGRRFQLNVTTTGDSVNIATGLTNTTIDDTVYSDDHLAIYKVQKVLLPIDIFTPKPALPPSPPLEPSKIEPDQGEEEEEEEDAKDKSDAVISSIVGYDLILFGLIGIISPVFCL